MLDIIIDTLLDGVKLLPFLFIAFLLIELLEHNVSNKTQNVIQRSGKFGPLLGSILGLIPQCGFSVMATNLYITRVVSLGTLISIYLSTSDEMIPILLSEAGNVRMIIKILLVKFMIGMIAGFVVDFIFKKKEDRIHYDICKEEHCHCEDGIVKSAITHTIHIFIFILVITFILNLLFSFGLEEYLRSAFHENVFITPLVTSLIGFIPNCGSSVIITELYINGVINFASMISGLLTGSGVAILVLFKSNKNLKENFKILCILYIVAVLSGILLQVLG